MTTEEQALTALEATVARLSTAVTTVRQVAERLAAVAATAASTEAQIQYSPDEILQSLNRIERKSGRSVNRPPFEAPLAVTFHPPNPHSTQQATITTRQPSRSALCFPRPAIPSLNESSQTLNRSDQHALPTANSPLLTTLPPLSISTTDMLFQPPSQTFPLLPRTSSSESEKENDGAELDEKSIGVNLECYEATGPFLGTKPRTMNQMSSESDIGDSTLIRHLKSHGRQLMNFDKIFHTSTLRTRFYLMEGQCYRPSIFRFSPFPLPFSLP